MKSLPSIHALPKAAQQIAEIIGVEDTLKLAYAAKNRHVYVPQKLTPDCKLVEQIGWEVATKLHSMFRGELLFVPLCRMNELSTDKLTAMREAMSQGVTVGQLARITGFHENGICKALLRERTASMGQGAPGGIGSFCGGGPRVGKAARRSRS